ncbi:MAG: cupin [Myxococcaceae bacterium]|nr:cupin [Myxococcaceae bacterium]
MRPAIEIHDPYERWLHSLRLTGLFYCQSLLSAPWALRLPAQPGCACFHLAHREPFWIDFEDGKVERIEAGDFVLITQSSGHAMRGDARRRGRPVPIDEIPCERLSERYRILRHGGGGPVSELLCGVVQFEHPLAQGLIAPLPRMLRLRAGGRADEDWLRATIKLIGEEVRELAPGADTLVSRLIDALAIRAIRGFIESSTLAGQSWLAALTDRQVGRALAAMHAAPARSWSVAELARIAGMSRAAFAARFHALAGEPPMQHLTRWRMQLAHLWLREGPLTIAQIAERLGYTSEASFSRTFKRTVGCSPGTVRRPAAHAEARAVRASTVRALAPAPR